MTPGEEIRIKALATKHQELAIRRGGCDLVVKHSERGFLYVAVWERCRKGKPAGDVVVSVVDSEFGKQPIENYFTRVFKDEPAKLTVRNASFRVSPDECDKIEVYLRAAKETLFTGEPP